MTDRPADLVARAALARGPLVRSGATWSLARASTWRCPRSGRAARQRGYSSATIGRLIAAGEAERLDPHTVIACHTWIGGPGMTTRETLDQQRRMLRDLVGQADALKSDTAELKTAIGRAPNIPSVMSAAICPRCRVRYLPHAGTCKCQSET
jgi:hypothetical protein